MKKLLILLLLIPSVSYGQIFLLDKVAPKNAGFTGMVDADQVLGGGGSGTLPDACVAESNVAQHTHAGTDITVDLEEETHASEHAVGGADACFPADPNADKCLMWDDAPVGELVWTDCGGGGGNAVYVEEGDVSRVDSSGADLYIDFDNADFDVGTVGNEANVTVNDGGIDHGGIGGLADDDHTQYHLTDGSRAMTGSLTIGDNSNADFSITFDSDTSDGTINYDEDNGDFEFNKDVSITTGEWLYVWDGTNADWVVVRHDGTDAIISSNAGAIDLMPHTDLNVILPDAAGARKLSIQDSGVAEVASVDSNGDAIFNSVTAPLTGNVTGDASGSSGSCTGLAATATALAANGNNCAAGSYPLGVDASGAAEGCTDATTEIDSAIATHAGDNDAHHALVTLTGIPDYITLIGQQITRGTIDIGDDTNLAASRSLTLTGDSVAADAELYVFKAKIAFEDPTATDDFFFGEIAVNATATSIYCKTLVGTVTLDVTIAGTDINGTDITCTTAGVLDSSLGGDTDLNVGEELKLAITSVASSPTYLMVQINGTYDD